MAAHGLPGSAGLDGLSAAVRFTTHGLQMTPRLTGTDGFYVSVLQRQG
jgi:16S rRNA (cytosine967-C5)-methyltransferase